MSETRPPDHRDESIDEAHVRDDECIRGCCAGLRDGYAEAWTEAERRRD
ncbi:hypothetical protein [Haloglomus litoreum]|nr:hypothetical protein [Haloglomus sp. DT116]